MAQAQTSSGRRGIGDFLSNLVFRAVLFCALCLPYRWRVPLSGWVVSRLVAPLTGWRKRVRENLAYALPDLPPEEIRRLERAVPDNAGRTLIEMYSGEAFLRHARAASVEGPGLVALRAARNAGQPVILVTGHFGNYDAPRAALFAQGFRIGGLYREMNNGYFNDHYVRAMARIGTPLFARGRRGLTDLIRYLRGGGMVGILIDQYMFDGADLEFFGKPAPTALSAAELALKYDALLVPIYGIRASDGLNFHVVCEAPLPIATAEKMTQALNDSLERRARDHLDQWFWIHRRWKPELTAYRQSIREAATTGPSEPS